MIINLLSFILILRFLFTLFFSCFLKSFSSFWWIFYIWLLCFSYLKVAHPIPFFMLVAVKIFICNFKIYLFIWLFRVLVAACRIFVVVYGIFSCVLWTLSCGMWDLVPWSGIEPGSPALGAWSISHWTPGKSNICNFYT